METRVDCLTGKVELLEKSVELFRREFTLKMKIVEQLLSTKNDQLALQKKSLDQETTLYKFLLTSWTDDLLKTQIQTQSNQFLKTNQTKSSTGDQQFHLVQNTEEIIPRGNNIYVLSESIQTSLPASNSQGQVKSTPISDINNLSPSTSSSNKNGSCGTTNSEGQEKESINIESSESTYFEPEEIEIHGMVLSSNFNEEGNEGIISISDDDENENSCSSMIQIKMEETNPEDLEIIQSSDETFYSSKVTNFGYNCRICGSFQRTSAALKSHMKIHGNSNGGFICHYCGRNFAQLGSLNYHKQIHLDGKCLRCSLCIEDEFPNLKMLITHMKNQHGIEKQICEICSKHFAGPTYLKRHMCIFHNQEIDQSAKRNKKCSLCPKSYQTRADLLVHIRSHTGERPYQCPGCHKNFADMRNLKRHQERFPDCKIANQISSSTFYTKPEST